MSVGLSLGCSGTHQWLGRSRSKMVQGATPDSKAHSGCPNLQRNSIISTTLGLKEPTSTHTQGRSLCVLPWVESSSGGDHHAEKTPSNKPVQGQRISFHWGAQRVKLSPKCSTERCQTSSSNPALPKENREGRERAPQPSLSLPKMSS